MNHDNMSLYEKKKCKKLKKQNQNKEAPATK